MKLIEIALQWHYSILQAMALEEDLPEHPIDHTLPKYKMIEKHVSGTVGQWGHVLDQTSSTLFQPVPTGNKRKRTKVWRTLTKFYNYEADKKHPGRGEFVEKIKRYWR